MNVDLSLYVGVLSISSLIALVLGVYAWTHRAMPGAVPFTFLMADVALWAGSNAFEMAGSNLPEKLFWANLQYLCYTTIPLLWLALALHFTGRERYLTSLLKILLCLIPVITNVLVWTNPAHGLIRRNVFLDTAGPFSVVGKTYGPWIQVHVGYSYLLMACAALLFLLAARSRDRVYRGQALTILASLLFPMAWNILYVIGLSPVKRHDISPALLSLVGVTVTWGLFRFRTFDILPVAQDAVLNSLQDGVIVLNTQGQIAAINPAAQRVFEWPATSVIGRTAVEVFSPWPEIVQWIHNRREAQIEFTLSPAAGASRHYDLALSPLFDSFKRPIGQLILLHDITERKTVEETLRSLSQTDSLTGLANRRRFFDVLKNEVNRARRYGLPLSVIIIDIDDMKSINDTCGHQEGDDALRKIGDHIRPMRQSDQAARIGGDEFALLLPSTDKDGAGRLAWRLYETAQPIRTECGIAVSISLGIAGLELGDDFEGESMLARADQAMYRAKHGRLGCVVDGNSG